jgi:hypothetical protein
MTKPPQQKPIGETGPVRVTHSKSDPLVTWEKIRFPSDKAAQEMLVASAFVEALNAKEGTTWSINRLEENDFDFDLRQGEEQRYLELQEIIIPPAKRGTPYSSREQVIVSAKFSDTILSEIRKKSAKYPRTLGHPLDLLIYVTHWRFLPNQTVQRLVAHHLKHNDHPFARVYELQMLTEKDGTIERLFPNDVIPQGFDHRAGTNRYINFDPAECQPVKNANGSIGVALTVGPDALNKLRGS